MIIKEFSADGFKNLKNIDLSPAPGVNVIIGENAQGKTNLLEAIWILSGAKSFRGTKEKEMISFDGKYARLGALFEDSQRVQRIEAVISKNPRERRLSVNGVKQRYFSGLFGLLKCVVFTPEDLNLTKGPPEARRSFIDLCISQIKPAYSKTVLKYENVLLQRNTLLKNLALRQGTEADLDIWDEQMARLGAYISVIKYQYTKKLSLYAGRLYSELTSGKEDLKLEYRSSIYEDMSNFTDQWAELTKIYLDSLIASRGEDIAAGFTTAGVHRDDVSVYVKGISVKDYGSQGQNRSAALSMKLAQAYILCEETAEMPVILLDDVLSELDRSRREFIISKLKDMQIFITCCEPVARLKGKRYEMSGGRVLNKQR